MAILGHVHRTPSKLPPRHDIPMAPPGAPLGHPPWHGTPRATCSYVDYGVFPVAHHASMYICICIVRYCYFYIISRDALRIKVPIRSRIIMHETLVTLHVVLYTYTSICGACTISQRMPTLQLTSSKSYDYIYIYQVFDTLVLHISLLSSGCPGGGVPWVCPSGAQGGKGLFVIS